MDHGDPELYRTADGGKARLARMTTMMTAQASLLTRVLREPRKRLRAFSTKTTKRYSRSRNSLRCLRKTSVLKKEYEDLTSEQCVGVLVCGTQSTDVGIESAKINIFHSYQANFDMAVKFMSDLIDRHAAERSLIMQSGTGVIKTNT
jgi:hypothetical protein